MKGFFARPGAGRSAAGTPGGAANAAAGALASFSLPPYSQPLPEKLISIHVTDEGLLLLPRPTHHHAQTHHHSREQSDSTPLPAQLRTTDESRAQDVAHEKRREEATIAAGHTPAQAPSGRTSAASAHQIGNTAVRISWGKSASVSSLTVKEAKEKLTKVGELNQGAETLAFGVVGLLRVFKGKRQHVAFTRTPLSSCPKGLLSQTLPLSCLPCSCIPPRHHQPRARRRFSARIMSGLPIHRSSQHPT